MNDLDTLANCDLAQLTEKDRIRLASSFAEFTDLLREAHGRERLPQLIERTSSVANNGGESNGIEVPNLPAHTDGEDANVYMFTKLLPYVENALVPKLRYRIARNKAAAEAWQSAIEEEARLTKEIARLKQDMAEIEHRIFVARLSSNEPLQSSHFLH